MRRFVCLLFCLPFRVVDFPLPPRSGGGVSGRGVPGRGVPGRGVPGRGVFGKLRNRPKSKLSNS